MKDSFILLFPYQNKRTPKERMCVFAAFDEFKFCFLQVFGVGNPPAPFGNGGIFMNLLFPNL